MFKRVFLHKTLFQQKKSVVVERGKEKEKKMSVPSSFFGRVTTPVPRRCRREFLSMAQPTQTLRVVYINSNPRYFSIYLSYSSFIVIPILYRHLRSLAYNLNAFYNAVTSHGPPLSPTPAGPVLSRKLFYSSGYE